MANRMQHRRGTAAAWASANPILADGEPGYATDTGALKVGDGVRAWNNLPALANAPELVTSAQNAAASAAASVDTIRGNSHVLLDTDGEPYFDAAQPGTQVVLIDTDGDPYLV